MAEDDRTFLDRRTVLNGMAGAGPLVALARMAEAQEGDGGSLVSGSWLRSDAPAAAAENVGRVHEILSTNGGRIYQEDVGAAAGWSEAAVCRTLSQMVAEGEIVRIRDGPKKVVCHPERVTEGHETDAGE